MKIKTAKNILLDILKQVTSENVESNFSNLVNIDDLIAQIVFELIKEQYYENLLRFPLRTYVSDMPQSSLDTLDAAYEQLKRNRVTAANAQNQLYQQIGVMPPQTNDFKSKAEGYQYNSLQIHEINNYQNLEIIKSLMKGRMANSKKISRTHFRDIFQEYDSYVRTQMKKAENSPQERLIHSIDFYDLQIRMKIELTYSMALYMEKCGIHSYPNFQASFFVSGFYGKHIVLQNRFILKQAVWLKYVFSNEQDDVKPIINELFQLLQIKKRAVDIFHTDISSCNFDINDMADFVHKEYNPFSIFQDNKEWNNTRIDLARKILKPFWIKQE